MNDSFEPVIVAFCCNWCSYRAADTAGIMRLQVPANVRVVRVMCSGRVDWTHVLRALADGADGVAVNGCHPGDCHYIAGNLRARERMDFLEAVLEHFGLRERVEMNYIAASEPDGFRDRLSAFTEEIRQLGPSPVKGVDFRIHELKRETLLDALEALRQRLDVDFEESVPLDSDLVVGGFGHPTYDPDKCIGCAACYHSCPRHNIEMEVADGVRRISYFHSLCDTCCTCQDVCPVGAITVEKRCFDLGAFVARKKFPAVTAEMRACASCGEHFVPARQVEHLLAQEAARGVDRENPVLCERCRREKHALEMRRAFLASAANMTRGASE